MKSGIPASILVLGLSLAPAVRSPAAGAPQGPFVLHGFVDSETGAPPNCLPETERASRLAALGEEQGSRPAPGATALYPTYAWPLTLTLEDDLILVNYVDDDMSGAIVDYEGLPHSYNGHNGTDLSLLNFREMDHGWPVLAAAPGVVLSAVRGNPDRNYQAPFGSPNEVLVDNLDGTRTWYLHLRRNSLTVAVGETLQTGQVIGLTGSSGNSTDAHLHMECGTLFGVRDPWNGSYNTLPSLWSDQEPYVGNDPIHVYDMGVATRTSVGGDENNISWGVVKERFSQPDTLGTGEPILLVWMQMQGQATDSYTLEVRRPDNSLFSTASTSLGVKFQYGWHWWWWTFNGSVSPADYGQWTASIIVGGQTVRTTTFAVGPSTSFGPRFTPIAGKSFRINGSTRQDTLRVTNLGGPVTYSLAPNAPSFVSLSNDSIVVIGGVSDQPTRSRYFQAYATDAHARQDTIWYHIVDMSKPHEIDVVGVGPTPGAPGSAGLALEQNAPNPFMPSTAIRFSVPARAAVSLAVYDTAGRLVRRLLDATVDPRPEGHTVVWDGRTNSGAPVASGVYFYRLESGKAQITRKMLVVR
jgi:murein DD-endopeptidase MepM/ murein hydrolase activator NlpD